MSSSEREQLKPCPFCGCEDVALWLKHRVLCPRCEAEGPSESEEAAVNLAAWNRRAQHSTAEPFGYFRADPFGWTDCAATDEGAKALYEAAPQQASREGEEPWVPCVITHDGQHPEEVAYGPRAMMDRLKKWLDRYFGMLGNLDAAIAYCPTCCQGVTARKEMTRDEVIFECGKTAGRESVRRALALAVDHIDMAALRISHCKDAAGIQEALHGISAAKEAPNG